MAANGVIRVHHTKTVDREWDSSVAERRLGDDDVRGFRRAFAFVDRREPENKTDAKFPHHEVTSDGKVGAANVRALINGVAILNGGRGGADISERDRHGIYRHLAAHLKDAGREPPELQGSGGGRRAA